MDNLLNECLNRDEFTRRLRDYILNRLHLEPDEAEQNLYRLCVLSLKILAGNAPSPVGTPDRYDCHQTNIAVKKKVLLIMHLEKLTGVKLDDDTACGLESITQLADAIYNAKEN